MADFYLSRVIDLITPGSAPVPYCMNEFATCNANEEVIFNNLLRSSQNQIECAFGCLKARWQILNTRMSLKLENVPYVIYACFVLHNICSINCILVDDESIQRQIMHDRQMQPVVTPDLIYSCNSAEGISTIKKTKVRIDLLSYGAAS